MTGWVWKAGKREVESEMGTPGWSRFVTITLFLQSRGIVCFICNMLKFEYHALSVVYHIFNVQLNDVLNQEI